MNEVRTMFCLLGSLVLGSFEAWETSPIQVEVRLEGTEVFLLVNFDGVRFDFCSMHSDVFLKITPWTGPGYLKHVEVPSLHCYSLGDHYA